jgi:hypothetical protein
MSNAFMGQRQQASPMGYGGYSGGYDPFGGGGYGTQFGGYDMGGGGGFGGYGGGMRAPAYEPTINDAFSRYFSQQYYGGPAFDPFAATSFFGGGYGGGFGFGGGGRRGGGMGGRMRRRRQMFEDLFQPENTPLPQPQPMPIGGGAYQPGGGGQRVEMGPVEATGMRVGESRTFTGPNALSDGFNAMEKDRIARERQSMSPQPYMGTDVDSIMPVQMQDTPVQSAPMFYEPPQMQPYAPAPFASPFSRPGRDMFTGSFGYGMR